MSDNFGDGNFVAYLDPHIYRLIMIRENCATLVHQRVAMSGKCKACREAAPIGHCKQDYLARCTALDHGSLAVGALRNEGTRGRFLLGNCQLRRKHDPMPTADDLRGESTDVVVQAFANCVCQLCVHLVHVKCSGLCWGTD